MAFVACASYPGIGACSNAAVEAIAVAAATSNTDTDVAGCATMGEKLVVRPGAEIVVAVVVRDPKGSNFAPYTFPNPSLLQVGINQPMNAPVLDHIDLIRGMVTRYKLPGAADYAGQWPANTAWLKADGTTPVDLSGVPAAAKNTSAAMLKSFSGNGATPWAQVNSGVDNTVFLKMSYRIPAVQASQYLRLRGTNLPASVPFETDASGNPLSDLYTNSGDGSATALANLKIACTTAGSNLPANGDTYTGAAIQWLPQPPAAGQRPKDGGAGRGRLGRPVVLQQPNLGRGGWQGGGGRRQVSPLDSQARPVESTGRAKRRARLRGAFFRLAVPHAPHHAHTAAHHHPPRRRPARRHPGPPAHCLAALAA